MYLEFIFFHIRYFTFSPQQHAIKLTEGHNILNCYVYWGYIHQCSTDISRCYQFSPMQGTIIHKRSSHACFVKIKYLFTIVNYFVHLFHPKPVQNIITIKPPCVYSAHNDVTYFRRLGEFDKGRSISLQKV